MTSMSQRTENNIFGLDLSQFQGTLNWNAISGNNVVFDGIIDRGIDFAWLRAGTTGSGGSFNTDTEFIANVQGAQSVGIPTGGYYFFRPLTSTAFAEDQADQFISLLESAYGAGNYGELMPMLDFETLDGEDITTALERAQAFRERFESVTGRTMILYTFEFFVTSNNNFNNEEVSGNPLVDMPLWIARWSRFDGADEILPDYPNSVPQKVGGWEDWLVWQWTDSGTVQGMTITATNITVNAFSLSGVDEGRAWNMINSGASPAENAGPVVLGSEVVFLDGVLQVRNSFNSSSNLDNDYYVSEGVGAIVFNDVISDPDDIFVQEVAYPSNDFNAGPKNIDFLLKITPPTGFNVSLIGNDFRLNWTRNDEVDTRGYRIYANDTFIDETESRTFFVTPEMVDFIPEIDGVQTVEFYVTAFDDWHESDPSETIIKSRGDILEEERGFYGGRLEIDMSRQLEVERDSVAYDNDGTLRENNQIKYSDGKFNQGALFEEETENFLGEDGFLDSDDNEDGIANGFSERQSGTGAGVLEMSGEETTFQLNESQKIEKTGGDGDFGIISANLSCTKLNRVTFLYHLDSVSGGDLVLRADYKVEGNTVSTRSFSTSTVTSGFVPLTLFQAPDNDDIDVVQISAYFEDTSTGVCYIQIIQTEDKNYRTSFINGIRERDIVKIETNKNVLDKKGTISFWIDVNDWLRDDTGTPYMLSHHTGDFGNTENWFVFRRSVVNEAWQFILSDELGNESTIQVDDVLSTGFHQFVLTWDEDDMILYIDGSEVGSESDPNLPDEFSDFIYLGVAGTETFGSVNTVMDDVHFEQIVVGASEIDDRFTADVEANLNRESRYLLPFDLSEQHGQAGYRVTPTKSLERVNDLKYHMIWWNDVIYDDSEIVYEYSFDGGTTFNEITDKGVIPGVTVGQDLSGNSMTSRISLYTWSDQSPKMLNFYWRFVVLFGGGVLIPLVVDEEDKLEFIQIDLEQNIFNNGDVSVPFLLEVFGLMEDIVIRNDTTGKQLKINIRIEANERLIINTAFGEKSAVLIDAEGNETNVLPFVDIDVSEFWQLQPGANEVVFEALELFEGTARFTWREKFSGV